MLGQRQRFGVIIPSTNTVVEHDFSLMGPELTTYHYGRMYLERPGLANDDEFVELLEQIRASIRIAIRDVMTCEPTHLLMGMSAETFWGGVEGNAAFEQRVHDQSGLSVTTGASSCRAALEAVGAERISVFSPYQPIADREVGGYFRDAGFSTHVVTGLRCPSATAIAEVPPPTLEETVRDIDADDVDAIVQVGTNLSFVRQAAELEARLGKPVIAINTATLWHGCRSTGIDDRFEGFGVLFEQH